MPSGVAPRNGNWQLLKKPQSLIFTSWCSFSKFTLKLSRTSFSWSIPYCVAFVVNLHFSGYYTCTIRLFEGWLMSEWQHDLDLLAVMTPFLALNQRFDFDCFLVWLSINFTSPWLIDNVIYLLMQCSISSWYNKHSNWFSWKLKTAECYDMIKIIIWKFLAIFINCWFPGFIAILSQQNKSVYCIRKK